MRASTRCTADASGPATSTVAAGGDVGDGGQTRVVEARLSRGPSTPTTAAASRPGAPAATAAATAACSAVSDSEGSATVQAA